MACVQVTNVTVLDNPAPFGNPFQFEVGGYKIVFQADPPDPKKIPTHDLLGVTVILLSCFYREREFIRVGYYVSSEYDIPELNEQPPEVPQYERIVRNILADQPRVTRYQIDWAN